MMSRAAGPPLFFANLLAFSACAMIAFARNVHALFYHFDGSYLLVDARDQLKFGQPSFEYSSNLLQSIGNIQFPQYAWLLPFYWPIGWLSDTQTGKIACYLIIAAIVFATAYWLARLLSQPQAVALTAGWFSGILTTPFVSAPFFYPILSVAPDYVGDCCSAGGCVLVGRSGGPLTEPARERHGCIGLGRVGALSVGGGYAHPADTSSQHCASNFHMFYILVKDLPTRTRLIEHLKRDGIHAVFHYVPLHTSPVGGSMGYLAGMLPVTETCADRIVRLPLYAGLRDDEADCISESVRRFFGR